MAPMGCSVVFHDRIGHERLAAAIAPQAIVELHALLTTALAETTRVALGADSVEVEVTLCGDTEMTHLNFDHMGDRGPTDVLAFPLHEWLIDGLRSRLTDDDGVSPPGALLLGDVVVDVDQAVRQAVEGGWNLTEEIALLAIHGTLHLLGHDHDEIDDEEKMRAVEHTVTAALHRKYRDVRWHTGSLFDRAGRVVSSVS
jgi:probable rRNA maturation factor